MKAYKWYEKSAYQKCSRGMNNLAALLYDGRGCKKNLIKAVELFKIAVGAVGFQLNV